MEIATIHAEKRIIKGRHTDDLRAEGKVPGVVYGFGTEPMMLTLDRNQVAKLYKEAGESTVISLDAEGKTLNVLLQDIQFDPMTDFVTHVDFRAVDMSKKVEATIALKFVGLAPAVKELGGTFAHAIDELEVLALPSALVREIEVDVTGLKTFEDVIHVSDIVIPAGIEVLTDKGLAVANVQPPRSEEELAALDAPVEDKVAEQNAKIEAEKAAAAAALGEKEDGKKDKK